MEVLYGGKLWEWRFGSQRLKESLESIKYRRGVFLNGNGSGVCMMAPINEIEIVIQKKERRKDEHFHND